MGRHLRVDFCAMKLMHNNWTSKSEIITIKVTASPILGITLSITFRCNVQEIVHLVPHGKVLL